MKNCLNFKGWLMSFMLVSILLGTVTSAEAQSVRVTNSNPDKGGGGVDCLPRDINTVSVYVRVLRPYFLNIENVKIKGLDNQVQNISMVKTGPINARRLYDVWKVDLVLLNEASYYYDASNTIGDIAIILTINYGINSGENTLSQTDDFPVYFCLKETAHRQSNTQSESPIIINEIAPNPTKDKVTVNLVVSKKTEIAIRLVNGIGQEVKAASILETVDKGNYHQEIDMGDLPKGIYYLMVSLENGKVHTEKIMKL